MPMNVKLNNTGNLQLVFNKALEELFGWNRKSSIKDQDGLE
jgi:hypothetical protein